MAEQEKDKNLDQLLDSLLSSYSDVGPRPGLETRVIAKLRDHAGRSNSWNWNWTWIWSGTAATALAALVFIIGLESPVEPPQQRVVQADWSLLHHFTPVVVEVARVNKKRVQPRIESIVSVAAADTRPEVFPTPSPLSDQEKLMLRYLAHTTKQEIIAQSHPDKPLETEEPLQQQMQAPAQTEFKNSTR